jgi:hypothetical protein
MKKLLILAAALAICAGLLPAADQKVMHCFAYSAVETAAQADWDAFAKATAELPSKIPGLTHVWQGKLARPMSLYQPEGQVDAEVQKKLRAGEAASVNVKTIRRQNGVCMEFASPEALANYAKNPAHEAWVKAYEKVRVYGTTTFDIQVQ